MPLFFATASSMASSFQPTLTTVCRTTSLNLLEDDGTLGYVQRTHPSVFDTVTCYDGPMGVSNFGGMTGSVPSDAIITGVGIEVQGTAGLDSDSTGCTFAIHPQGVTAEAFFENNSPTYFPFNLKPIGSNELHHPNGGIEDTGGTHTIHITGSDGQGFGFTPGEYPNDGTTVGIKIRIADAETQTNRISFDYIKLIYHYKYFRRGTYNNAEAELSMKEGTLQLNEGTMELK